MRNVLNLEDFVGLGLTVAGGVVVGLIAAYSVFAAAAWVQDWWKDR